MRTTGQSHQRETERLLRDTKIPEGGRANACAGYATKLRSEDEGEGESYLVLKGYKDNANNQKQKQGTNEQAEARKQ